MELLHSLYPQFVGRLSPARAPESTFARGLLKSALSLAVFLGLEGLPLCSILGRTGLALGVRAALQMKPSGWWEEPRECAPGSSSCLPVTLSRSPTLPGGGFSAETPSSIQALPSIGGGGGGVISGLMSWAQDLLYLGIPPNTHGSCKLLSLVYKRSPLLPCICINVFPFSKSSEDIVLCNCVWLWRKPTQREAEGAGTMARLVQPKLAPRH